MLNLPHDLYTAQQIRDLEHIVIEQHDMPAAKLMSYAGAATLSLIKEHWQHAKRLLIICGIGNNGGDGFELAKQAMADGYHITIIQVGDNTKMTAESIAARDAFLSANTTIQPFNNQLPTADIIIDALFGSGLTRECTGEYKAVITAINSVTKHVPVLSLDIPSGLHADTGNVLGIAVKATVTLSFLGLHIGLFTGEAANYCGRICFDSLHVPPIIYNEIHPVARRISLEQDGARLAPRQRTSHKGLYGHLLVMGGDIGMSGAARLAAEAGARVGAGLISIATRAAHSSLLNLTRPELMCYAVDDIDNIDMLIQRATVLTIGPGLGQNEWGQVLFQKIINSDLPMVVDADALNILSKHPRHRDHWILTPHPGEAARLLGCSSAEIQADRFFAVSELQKRYGGVAILKGSGTLICNGETPIRLSTWGNPGMSSGGMGDVLAGVIGGLLAQGFPLMEAACVGVSLHGIAGDKAAEQDGERGMLAMDLIPHLRHLANLIF